MHDISVLFKKEPPQRKKICRGGSKFKGPKEQVLKSQSSTLPSGPKEDAVVGTAIPMAADAHTTLVDRERGAAAAGERLGTPSEVSIEEVFTTHTEMHC
jgi:hypothetical protein